MLTHTLDTLKKKNMLKNAKCLWYANKILLANKNVRGCESILISRRIQKYNISVIL